MVWLLHHQNVLKIHIIDSINGKREYPYSLTEQILLYSLIKFQPIKNQITHSNSQKYSDHWLLWNRSLVLNGQESAPLLRVWFALDSFWISWYLRSSKKLPWIFVRQRTLYLNRNKGFAASALALSIFSRKQSEWTIGTTFSNSKPARKSKTKFSNTSAWIGVQTLPRSLWSSQIANPRDPLPDAIPVPPVVYSSSWSE